MMKDHIHKTLFLSYAPEDDSWRQKLERHLSELKRQGRVTIWHNRLLPPGSNQIQETDAHFNQASIILLLISDDFLASDSCCAEMQQALARQQAGKAQVIPLLLRPVEWKQTPIGHLHPLPIDGNPITLWNDVDDGCIEDCRI
ncbi:MAG: toll/interleukin-1 receptor domain-containing protein [Ktedonobacteraceae bacterium]|nr:toll/interleukin-1 receptor domain-containing protein [Ktedonobacteraceae bacterium]